MGTRDRVIPNWVGRSDPSGQLRPDANNAAARGSGPIDIQAPTIAEDAIIPIVYGGPERIAGMPYTTCLASNQTDLLVSYILCEGEIEAITSVELNDEPLPSGVVVSGYYGTQTQDVDSDLADAIIGYNEKHLGTAYIVARFPPGSVTSFPNLTAEIYGRKILNRGLKGVLVPAAQTNHTTVAASAQNRINGATYLDFMFIGALQSWGASAAAQVLISKHASPGGLVASYQFNAAGLLRLFLSSTGATYNIVFDCPVALVPLAANQFGGVRAICNLASGANRYCQFYYSSDAVHWIELGAPVILAGTFAVLDPGGLPWQVAGRGAGTEALNAIGTVYSGTSVTQSGVQRVRFNPEDATDGATSWPAPTGELWTIAGGQVVATKAAHASTNPAAILDDFMRTYGRRLVNAKSVAKAAAFCDTDIANTKRATLTITLGEARDADAWVEALRGYLPAWVIYMGGEWHIVVDAPSAPVLAYNADTDARTDGDDPMVLVKRGTREVPNVIEVTYTETATKPWSQKKAVAQLPGLGVGQRRRTGLQFPGIRTFAQAYRFAVERLNHFTLENIEGDVAVMDNGIAVTPGDIVSITDSAHGWLAKPVRVLRVDETDNGRYALRFRVYDANAYSTDAPVAPAPPDSGTLPNPIDVPSITGLSAVEVLSFESASINLTDGLARGLVWQSRVAATWSESPDPFFDFYEISLQGGGLPQPSVSTSKLAKFCSAPLPQGATYTVSVRVINSLGFSSAPVVVSVIVNGKVAPPGNVTNLDFAAEIGGECILRWRPVPDVDVVRYEWRALATSALTAPWDSMAVIDRPDTNYTRIKGLQPGATLLAIKAIDSVGRYSTDALYVNLTITSDSGSFLNTFEFTPNTTTSSNLTQYDYPLVEGGTRPLPRWITTGQNAWNAAMPNPVASSNPYVVAAFGRNQAFVHRTDVWDFGLAIEATVQINLTNVRSLRGNTVVYLAFSLDNTTYDYTKGAFPLNQGAVNGWVAAKATARYVKVEIYSNTVNDAVMIEGKIPAQVSSNTRSESGSATSSATPGVGTRCNLAQKYTKAVSITITPQGTSFATGTADNVTVGLAVTPNYFDVYLFDAAGNQTSKPFSWTFRGV